MDSLPLYYSAVFYFTLLYLVLPISIAIETVYLAKDNSMSPSRKRCLLFMSLAWLLPVSFHTISSVRLELFFILSLYALPVPAHEMTSFHNFIIHGRLLNYTNLMMITGLTLFFINRRCLLGRSTLNQ